ncbi:MAG TPA: EthD family reductase [Candidatus Thermoplasmatota archaeon]|nr:EthD family reductase [Candidatus Thermoplasmatota archaeon]
MIRVLAFYGQRPGGRFDFDYYAKSHIPLVQKRLSGFGLVSAHLERGVGGVEPGAPPKYAAIASYVFKNVDGFQKGFATHGAELMADVPNYTDLEAIIQINDILA